MDAPFQLQRFLEAQSPVYARVCRELAAGQKSSHWMWFVFPQLRELGRSETARFYGIGSREEAQAYWQHPVLGPRLRQCVEALLVHQDKSALQILGSPDETKLRSSLTLFARAAPHEPLFTQALTQFYDGQPDARTLALLR